MSLHLKGWFTIFFTGVIFLFFFSCLPQVVKVHQNTVDTYLEDMILMSMDMTADSQARREVQVLAEQINDIAYELEDK